MSVAYSTLTVIVQRTPFAITLVTLGIGIAGFLLMDAAAVRTKPLAVKPSAVLPKPFRMQITLR